MSGGSGVRGRGYGPAGPAVPGAGAAPRPTRRAMPGFGLRGPRRDRHVLGDGGQLGSVALPVGDDGVVIGVDAAHQPVTLGVNRPTPFDVVLVGGLWTAQVIAFRTVATGARVAVETARPHVWTAMAQAAGGGQQAVTIHEPGRVPPQGASVAGPVLIVRDCGAQPPRGRVSSAPWQSVLTLLPYVGPNAPRLLRNAELVGVQRVSPQEAEVIGRVLTVPGGDLAVLPTLDDSITLWCTRRHRQFVMTEATDAESGLLGVARRVD
ncbi:hypothetical protein [Streptomyces sp. HPF1205]|uniref:hypothetical protein n=1 Tax=Streptomyces sp. HPF1205 TaxID=2873262 RepID=UPI0035ABA84B